MRILSIILLTTLLVSCSTYSVTRITGASTSTRHGLVYFLPKIEYDIVVTYDIVTSEPSTYYKSNPTDFKKEVERIMGFEYIDSSTPKYQLKTIELNPVILPDENNAYSIEFRKKNALMLKKKYLFELTEQGYLKSGNILVQNNTSDLAFATLEAASNFVKSAYGTPLAAAAGGTSLKLIVDKILTLRKQREDLISGSLAPDLSYVNTAIIGMYDKLKEEEDRLIRMISGSEKTKTFTKTVRHVPVVTTGSPLFYFSSTNGFSLSSTGAANEKNVQIMVSDRSNQSLNLNPFLNSKATNIPERRGLFYRIPASMAIQITDGTIQYLNKLQIIPQLGNVAFLPNRVGLVKNDTYYTLDPITGALLKFDANSEGINVDQTKSFLSSASSLPESLKKPKVEKTGFEETEKAIKRLELDIKYQELQLKYDSLRKE
jgi:hypothetical protein